MIVAASTVRWYITGHRRSRVQIARSLHALFGSRYRPLFCFLPSLRFRCFYFQYIFCNSLSISSRPCTNSGVSFWFPFVLPNPPKEPPSPPLNRSVSLSRCFASLSACDRRERSIPARDGSFSISPALASPCLIPSHRSSCFLFFLFFQFFFNFLILFNFFVSLFVPS